MTTTQDILVGDCIEVMATLPERSVHCCVTSPPYWGLRDYGVDGAIGLESTPDEYLAKIVDVFRAVWRVLRDDGTCWVNLGDTYTSGNRPTYRSGASSNKGHQVQDELVRPATPNGLKPKDLCGIPWRVAFALQADGWYLRSDIIWSKPNPMPESCTDRPTKAHEYVFLLTKKPRYYYDALAVREVRGDNTHARHAVGCEPSVDCSKTQAAGSGNRNNESFQAAMKNQPQSMGRNRRTVWTIPTEPFAQAHFATYPRKLVAPCIKAGTSDKGCCSECGTPWVRVVEKDRYATRPGSETKLALARGAVLFKDSDKKGRWDAESDIVGNRDQYRHVTESRTVGWEPGCGCQAYIDLDGTAGEPSAIPCTVLDPFAGSGTTGVVAKDLGRNFIGIELNPEYAAMAERRIANPEPEAEAEDVAGQMQMFEEPTNA